MTRFNPLEAPIEGDVCAAALRLWGVENVKLYKKPGWPDRVFLIPGGRPVMIEFKRPNGKPEPLQDLVHKRLRLKGYDVQVHDSRATALAAIGAALEAARVPKDGPQVLARAQRRRAVP